MYQHTFDWSNPPHVDPDDAEDFAEMAGDDDYEGMSVPDAKEIFKENGLGWHDVTPERFKQLIQKIREVKAAAASRIASACFVFCDEIIDATYRKKWVIAVMAAADVHEGGDRSDDDDGD